MSKLVIPLTFCYRLLALAASASALTPLAMPGATAVALPLSAAFSLGALLLADRRVTALPPAGAAPREAETAPGDRLLCLFEQAPLGLVRVDRHQQIRQWNPAFVRLLDDDRQMTPGLAFSDLLAPESMATFQEAAARLPPPSNVEVRFQGERKRKAMLHFSHDLDDGRLIYVVDVTAFKELESKLMQPGKMQAIGQLAGGIAHDFNNLLTAMIGFCDLLLQRHKAGDASFADIVQIKQNANRATSLVRQLLAFSRQQTLHPKILDITGILNELSYLLRRLIGQAIALRLTFGRDLWPVRVDQNQFEQVIVNLAVNARDAMPQGGELSIHSENAVIERDTPTIHEVMPPGNYVLIQIKDTGSGIPAALIGQIFEPFFTTKPPGQGTGLGLSTVYGIVRQTGGFIQVTSTPGQESCFSIYLPSHAGQAAAEKTVTGVEANETDFIGAGVILLVEDEDPVRLFAARALRGRGYRVLEARSGEAALELLSKLDETLDLMITDVIMPGIDLPSLIEMVRSDRPDLKILCISGHTDDDLLERIMAAGNIGFLPKPFSLKQLAGRVHEAMMTRAH